MGNMKVVINKFVILSKLRKEVERVNFSFKKWGVAVHTRLEGEWVSYDLKGNKVECPLKNNGDTRIFVWHSHKEMKTRMCDIHTKIRERTRRAFVWHSHKEEWDSSTQKRGKKVCQSTQNKGNVWKKRKQ